LGFEIKIKIPFDIIVLGIICAGALDEVEKKLFLIYSI
jgi:hypothetical protein